MFLGLPSGTTSVTSFCRMLKRVSLSMRSRPSSLPLVAAASSWFICFWPAEMNTSHSAPSWIWVLSVPEESKLNETWVPVSEVNASVAFVRLSVMLAAAKTVRVSATAVEAAVVDAVPVASPLPPHAVRPRPASVAMPAPSAAMACLRVMAFMAFMASPFPLPPASQYGRRNAARENLLSFESRYICFRITLISKCDD